MTHNQTPRVRKAYSKQSFAATRSFAPTEGFAASENLAWGSFNSKQEPQRSIADLVSSLQIDPAFDCIQKVSHANAKKKKNQNF